MLVIVDRLRGGVERIELQRSGGLRYLIDDPKAGDPLHGDWEGVWKLRMGGDRIIYRIMPPDLRRRLEIALDHGCVIGARLEPAEGGVRGTGALAAPTKRKPRQRRSRTSR